MTSILKVSEIQDPTNSNTALSIDSNGIITQGSPVGFSAVLESALSITANATRLTGWDITTDMYGGFNTDGAGGTMLNLTSGIAQVPVTGYYSIILNCRIDSFSGTYHYVDVIKTDSSGTYSGVNSTLISRSLESSTASDYTELQLQSVAYLQANDYIAAYWANSGDNSVTAANESYFSMFRVG
jgi:hypothetical protein